MIVNRLLLESQRPNSRGAHRQGHAQGNVLLLQNGEGFKSSCYDGQGVYQSHGPQPRPPRTHACEKAGMCHAVPATRRGVPAPKRCIQLEERKNASVLERYKADTNQAFWSCYLRKKLDLKCARTCKKHNAL